MTGFTLAGLTIGLNRRWTVGEDSFSDILADGSGVSQSLHGTKSSSGGVDYLICV
jgi:hypothetical protein